MSRKLIFLLAVVICVMFVAPAANAGWIFVATAKNVRGALYLGAGPTPSHAAEIAIVKCSQDSFLPASCKICRMRKEIVPTKGPVKKYRPMKRYGKVVPPPTSQYANSWGRPIR